MLIHRWNHGDHTNSFVVDYIMPYTPSLGRVGTAEADRQSPSTPRSAKAQTDGDGNDVFEDAIT